MHETGDDAEEMDEMMGYLEAIVEAAERGEASSVRELASDELLSWFAAMHRLALLAGRFAAVLRAEIERREDG
jgi:predicted lipid-binding transport protein (Tim44 family)